MWRTVPGAGHRDAQANLGEPDGDDARDAEQCELEATPPPHERADGDRDRERDQRRDQPACPRVGPHAEADRVLAKVAVPDEIGEVALRLEQRLPGEVGMAAARVRRHAQLLHDGAANRVGILHPRVVGDAARHLLVAVEVEHHLRGELRRERRGRHVLVRLVEAGEGVVLLDGRRAIAEREQDLGEMLSCEPLAGRIRARGGNSRRRARTPGAR
jgi:hypothetical protein